jgi:dihydroorotate dehydrogenase electron transfer subunit
MKFSGYCLLKEKKEISPSVYKFTFQADEVASQALPGQFVQIRASDTYFPFWPRPFSIHESDPRTGEITIIFKIFGCGTSLLANRNSGQKLHILGPLGNCFPDLPQRGTAMLVAGGVGLPPLYFFARRAISKGLDPQRIVFIAGARTASDFFENKRLLELGVNLHLCTDDGSLGIKGTAVDVFSSLMKQFRDGQIYSCGPTPMLNKIDSVSRSLNINGYLSLEALMPCGFGICSGCAVKTYPPGQSGPTDDNRDYHLKRVCCEGPVFQIGEVIWD